MSRDASGTVAWADGEYKFRLGIAELRELQEKCDAGPMWIYERLQLNAHNGWRLEDIRETIRLGLIGGGLPPPEALALVKRYVDKRPATESILIAQAVLAFYLVGAPDEDDSSKKENAEVGTETSSPEEKSDLPHSTGQEPSLVLVQ